MRRNALLNDSNSILAFLQNILDDGDARKFVEIALDSLEEMHEQTGTDFDRAAVLESIRETDDRI